MTTDVTYEAALICEDGSEADYPGYERVVTLAFPHHGIPHVYTDVRFPVYRGAGFIASQVRLYGSDGSVWDTPLTEIRQ